MPKPTLWLRCEKKEFEHRAALTPTTSKKLIEAGFEIFVERDDQRIFHDSEYEASVLLNITLSLFMLNVCLELDVT
jgi:saccharopine dehydrogenase (NAD+, L-lysine-forming)